MKEKEQFCDLHTHSTFISPLNISKIGDAPRHTIF